MYLIYNTVAISVVQRRPEIGTLRALGVKRGQILRTFLAEGALFGVVGSLFGVVIGSVLATFSVAAVSRTVDTLYVASHADHVVYDPVVLLKAFLIGVVGGGDRGARTGARGRADAAGDRDARARLRAAAHRACAAGGDLRAWAACSSAMRARLLPPIGDVPLFGYAAGLLIIFAGSLFAPLRSRGSRAAGARAARFAVGGGGDCGGESWLVAGAQ